MAAAKVFDVAELLEKILVETGPVTIIRVRGVNRFCKALVDSSNKVAVSLWTSIAPIGKKTRRGLQFAYSSKDRSHICNKKVCVKRCPRRIGLEEDVRPANPIFEQDLQGFQTTGCNIHRDDERKCGCGLRVHIDLSKITPKSSCMGMHLTSPSVTGLIVAVGMRYTTAGKGATGGEKKGYTILLDIKSATGVTVKDLVDCLEEEQVMADGSGLEVDMEGGVLFARTTAVQRYREQAHRRKWSRGVNVGGAGQAKFV